MVFCRKKNISKQTGPAGPDEVVIILPAFYVNFRSPQKTETAPQGAKGYFPRWL